MSNPFDTLLAAAISATKETATDSLSISDPTLSDSEFPTVPSGAGAYMPLVSGEDSFYLGLLSSLDGCQAMARALFMMEEDEEDLGDDEVADACGEIINIVAGLMQRQILDKLPTLELGLPIFVSGTIQGDHKIVRATVALQDNLDVEIVLLTEPTE